MGEPYITPGEYYTLKSVLDVMFQFNYAVKAQAIQPWAKELLFELTEEGNGFNLGLIFDPTPIRKTPMYTDVDLGTIAIMNFFVPFAQFDHGFSVKLSDMTSMTNEIISKAAAGAEKYAVVLHNEVSDILRLGDTSAYIMPSGKNFFDVNIPIGPPSSGLTITNILSGPLNDVNLAAAIAAMSYFYMDDGTASEVEANWLVGPSTLKHTGEKLTRSKWIFPIESSTGLGADVPQYIGTMKSGWSARLSDQNNWFVLFANDTVRPIRFVRSKQFGTPNYTVNSVHDMNKSKSYEAYSFFNGNGYPYESRLAILVEDL